MRNWREEEKRTFTASEDFKRNLEDGFRYVDKTELLIPLLRRDHEATFFLRPRRFGKTLTLSMIRYFVEDTRDEKLNAENRELFQGMKIMNAGEKYIRQMTSYPVINLTLQIVASDNMEHAMDLLVSVIQSVYQKKLYLLEENRLNDPDRRFFQRIMYRKDELGQEASQADYVDSLRRLSEMLRKDAGKQAVVLIDEYDVPLEKAYQNGYYEEMVQVIGPMLQSVLKTNSDNLQFAVITGCLRIAKEGIYTGLNSPEVNTVLSHWGGDYIGFTETETRKLLDDSGVGDHFDQVKEWYDGYRFGNTVIYNPWSVIKHIEALNRAPDSPPLTYWANTSGNAIIRDLAAHANEKQREQIESLLQQGEITFSLRDNIVYNELFADPDNVWNVMLSAGYLTATEFDGDMIRARIPNKEVFRIYRDQIRGWFQETMKSFHVSELYLAMEQGNASEVERILNEKFLSSMSYYDSAESFYHGVLLTLMQLNEQFFCASNRESGDGRFDIMAKRKIAWDLAFVLEVKISEKDSDMMNDAREGIAQILENQYVKDLQREEYQKIMTYAVAFCRKRCRVIQGKTFSGSR